MRMSRLSPLILAALVFLAWAPETAQAADQRPVELPLTNGKSLTGTIESADEREVVIRLGAEQLRHIPWTRLAPLGFYRAKRALAAAADGAARLKLAELAAELGLYVEAREEYEKALALGAISKRSFKTNVAQAEQRAVENGVHAAHRLADRGDLEAAMETARRLKLHFASAPNAASVNKLVSALIRRIHKLDAAALEEKAELERVQLDSRRNKEILTRKTKALDLFHNGQKLMVEWKAKRAQGSVTRAKKLAAKIDKMFSDARINLGRLRRILPRDHRERKEINAQLNKLDAAQFDLRFGMAEFYAEGKIWSRAERWIALASYIDPVHPELVELRDLLLTSRIRYRASDMTNARGRVSGP